MENSIKLFLIILASSGALALPSYATWTTEWQAGAVGRGQPVDGTGGGPEVDFVQEDGAATPAPGNPNSPSGNQLSDDDYYFAGIYPAPIGIVAQDEISFERAFTANDSQMRIHFNLGIDPLINDNTQLRFSFEPWSLQGASATVTNRRYGVEVRLNGTLIMPEVLITESDITVPRTLYTSTPINLGAVGAQYGPNTENVLELTGINYAASGGGGWGGIDYHALELNLIPEPSAVGLIVCGSIVASLGYRKRKK